MNNKKQLDKIVDKAVGASFPKGNLDTKTVNRFINIFKGMDLVEGIYALTAYSKGIKRMLSQQTVVIESTIPLSSVWINKIKSKLSRLFTINKTQVTINPSILGGIKITIGDHVFDLTLKNRINQLKEAMTA